MSNKKPEAKKPKQAAVIFVHSSSIRCPHCNADQDGWVTDPRGMDHECDGCGKTYSVPENIRLSF